MTGPRHRYPVPGLAVSFALVVVLLVGAACAAGADTVVTGQGQGPVSTSVTPGLTRIAPDRRQPAPVVQGPSVDGGVTVSIEDHAGKVVVLNVWESSCGPCRAEARDLVRASHHTSGSSVFIGLNIREDRAAARAFTRAFGVDYPQISDRDGGQLLKFAGVLPLSVVPSTVLIDERGLIAARIVGPISQTTLVQLIQDVHRGY